VRVRASNRYRCKGVLAVGTLAVVGKAALVQIMRDGPTMGEGTLVVQADGARRYQYNPRLQEIMREITKWKSEKVAEVEK